MGRSQFTFYRSFWEAIQELPSKSRAEVVCAICSYALDGEAPNLSGTSKAIFSLIKPTLDASARKAEIGKLGGSKTQAKAKQDASKEEAEPKQIARENKKENKKENEVENEKEGENECSPPKKGPPQRKPKFIPPTLEEVTAYCRERGSSVDPKQFWEYFNAGGWVDAKGQPVQAWKQKLLTWEKYDFQRGGRSVPAVSKPKGPTQEEYDRMQRLLKELEDC